jgi:hypothetical protein
MREVDFITVDEQIGACEQKFILLAMRQARQAWLSTFRLDGVCAASLFRVFVVMFYFGASVTSFLLFFVIPGMDAAPGKLGIWNNASCMEHNNNLILVPRTFQDAARLHVPKILCGCQNFMIQVQIRKSHMMSAAQALQACSVN